MTNPNVKLVFEPTIAVLAETKIQDDGLKELREWLSVYRPACLPEEGEGGALRDLLPHGVEEDGRQLTDAEMLVELSGRKCYNSFGLKAGRKTNREYIEHTQAGDVPHASIAYHPKLTFFIAGVSRRVSHELIRHYVGADRSEEGSPSQESTRYTHHPGHFVVHPKVINDGPKEIEIFEQTMDQAYGRYVAYIESQFENYEKQHGEKPKRLARKRIYEASAGLLPMQAETSWVWTTNPIALAKMFRERCHEAADLEYQRFANKWKALCVERWPNLFPQPWMRER